MNTGNRKEMGCGIPFRSKGTTTRIHSVWTGPIKTSWQQSGGKMERSFTLSRIRNDVYHQHCGDKYLAENS